jgi:REP element-mobilizing transposase RayT
MPRLARKKSKSGIDHIMVRGINRQDIFHDDEDREKFLATLKRVKEISQCQVYGYCLMDNHVHLLIREGKEGISQIMKRIGIAYAYWYNQKYERSGHLFQDRFKSETVEDDSYFLGVLRYIHQNPIKGLKVHSISEYTWSSYGAYAKNKKGEGGLIDSQFALKLFSQEPKEAIEKYIDYMEQPQYEKYLDHNEKKKCTDGEVEYELAKLMRGRAIHSISQAEKSERDEILRSLKKIEGVSIRQIERITGIGRNVIANA